MPSIQQLLHFNCKHAGLIVLIVFLLGFIAWMDYHKSEAADFSTFGDARHYIQVAQNNPQKQLKHSEERCFERCKADDVMCQPRSKSAWNALLNGPYVTLQPVHEGLANFSWERDLLAFPALTDMKTLPDLRLSHIIMDSSLTRSSADQPSGRTLGEIYITCDVGERLVGRLDLIDGYGRARQAGLDEVRAWMVDTDNTKRRATGQVSDLRNGSYTVEVTCLWPSSRVKLYIALSYPREFLRTVVKQARLGATRFTVGKFKSKNGAEEDTVCNPTPNIPGRFCLCNFTSFNGQEFYCGHPLDERLNCSDWVATHTLGFPQPYQVTPAEREIIKNISGSARDRLLEMNIFINITSKDKLNVRPSCQEVSPSVTWDITSSPQGFWDKKGAWQSLVCQRSALDRDRLLACLNSFTVYITGDSNAFCMYSELMAMTLSDRDNTSNIWPQPVVAHNVKWNITLHLKPHEYPLFAGDIWRPVLTSGSVESQFDAMPSHEPLLVILHYYLHLTPFHLSAAQARISAAARAIWRLLQRNPKAYVAIRGPHVASKGWWQNPSIGGDPLGPRLKKILSLAFSGLKQRVIFLDGWDMTTALENEDFHPNNVVVQEMLKTVLSFIC